MRAIKEWIADFWPFILGVIIGILFVVAIVCGINWLGHWSAERSCNNKDRETSLTTKFVRYSFWSSDCLVEVNEGEYVPLDKYRVLDD